MKIAVTGANGFVGSALCAYLKRVGHEVYPVIRSSALKRMVESPTEAIVVDYMDVTALQKAFEPLDLVVHNAGLTRALTFSEMYHANVVTTSNILKALNSSKGPKRLIYISSQAAGRPSYNGIEVNETDKSSPLTWYGKSKYYAEQRVRNESRVPWTIIRPVSVYGEGDRDFLQLFKMIKQGLVFSLAQNYFNLIYVEELCEFIRLCIDKPGSIGEVFYAGDTKVYSQSQLVSAIEQSFERKAIKIKIPLPLASIAAGMGDLKGKITGHPALINSEKMKELSSESWLCSTRKAQEILGWNPEDRFDIYLQRTITWYEQNSLL